MSMVTDTSALVAIVIGEPDAERYVGALLDSAGAPQLSAANAVETAIVVEARQGAEAARDLQLLIEHARIHTHPVDDDQVHLAVQAWRRFGNGRHPAALNFGDCFAYALARTLGEPLLYKGTISRRQTSQRCAEPGSLLMPGSSAHAWEFRN